MLKRGSPCNRDSKQGGGVPLAQLARCLHTLIAPARTQGAAWPMPTASEALAAHLTFSNACTEGPPSAELEPGGLMM